MRKALFLFQSLVFVLALAVGCEQKPANPARPSQSNPPPTVVTNAPATNDTATAEADPLRENRIAAGERGMVVSVNAIATQAGVDVLKRGGNAIDAAAAVALTLGVVDAHNSGIGGGCFILIRHTNGAYNAIDGRECASGNATRDMFIRNGRADTSLSQVGALASATPGALAAYDLAVKKWGKLPLKDSLLAAAKVAEEGFPASRGIASASRSEASDLIKFPASAAIFLKDGKPFKEGDTFKNPDLGKTYRNIAQNGAEWFYGGPFARATEDWMKQNGGILNVKDFKNYQAQIREPLFSNYRGVTIATMPPPSSGGVHLIQILKIVETQDMHALRRSAADVIHFVAEAMKLAFADRAYWLGDPDWAKVPKNLVSKEYCAELAAKIQMSNVVDVATHGTPSKAEEEVFKSMLGKHTTHFAVVDGEGNWVACTATVNTSFGSKVVIPGTGVVLNNEMDDFAIEPGVPNHFKLVGAEANAVGPWKRPLSSMTPTILAKEGEPILSVGAAGGPTIITQVAQTIINYLDMRMQMGPDWLEMEMSIQDALRTPRFHHQWRPDELRMEKRWAPAVVADLEKRGHKIVKVESMGACQIIARHPDHPGLLGCPDPRGNGKAEGL
jgi:gamma-glutamyltranspeptidase / glutathione hydrolase